MPDLSPYTPALYLPGHYGRYRSYPRRVRTPIPGAGYEATLQWGEQPLNLWGAGHAPPTRYGVYNPAPLLGLGQNAAINRELGWSKSALRKYWNARAQQCRGFADEGACLARVARHVPVTIGGMGQASESVADRVTAVGVVGMLVAFGLGWFGRDWVRGGPRSNRGRRVRRNRRRSRR